MRKRSFSNHPSMVCLSQAKQSRNLLLSGLLVLALSILAYPQRDLNKEKPKEPPTVKPAPPVRKKKPPIVRPRAEVNPPVVPSKDEKKPDAESLPKGKGSILIELSALKLDPLYEADLHILVNGVELTDMKKKTETRIEFENIPNGLYTLIVKHPTIEDCKQEIEVKIGIALYVVPILNIKRGKLIVEGEPGAKVFLDDKPVAVIDKDGEAVTYASIGKHTLKVMKDGQTPFQKTIYILEGENFEKIEKIL